MNKISSQYPVASTQQTGITDQSGCQSGGHIHMARKTPNGTPVNFRIPCVNSGPTTNFWDGMVDDSIPYNL